MTLNSSSINHYNAIKKLPRRYRADRRFKLYGRVAITFALIFLLTLFGGIIERALPAFQKAQIGLDITFNPAWITPEGKCNLKSLTRESFHKIFPEISFNELKSLHYLISPGSCKTLLSHIRAYPQSLNRTVLMWLSTADDTDLFLKRKETSGPLEKYRRLNFEQMQALLKLEQKGHLKTVFNWRFFTQGDARNPEFAGIASAFIGSLYLMCIALLFAFPIGIAAALYMEEFTSRHSRISRFIEVNISNLAAVPSIVFGLLGLAIFLGFLGLPRSSTLAGGLTLGLMTLPTIIVSSRSALKAVPKTLRDAAQGLGASNVQVVFHHVVPVALPGILTGTIIGAARALGETAPLLMIGMMAFVADKAQTPLDPSSALPVQIFMWARNPEPGFLANAAAGIIALLVLLILMNMTAIILRQKYERKYK